MHSIVLARYKESLEWIAQIPNEFCVYIYNKGEKIDSPVVLSRANHIIDRPNIGRESETYLYHMLTVQEPVESFTVYSQADPFLHSPDFLPLLANWRDWDDVQALSWAWKEEENVPPKDTLAIARAALQGQLLVRPELFSLTNWGPLEFHDRGALAIGLVYTKLNGGASEEFNIAGHVLRRCGLHALADQAERHGVGTFSYGAIFATRNERTAAIPREGLVRLLEFSSEPVHAHGYMLERLWLHLVGIPFQRPKSRTASGRPAYVLEPRLATQLYGRDKDGQPILLSQEMIVQLYGGKQSSSA